MGKRLTVCCDGTGDFADQPSRTDVAGSDAVRCP